MSRLLDRDEEKEANSQQTNRETDKQTDIQTAQHADRNRKNQTPETGTERERTKHADV